MDFQIIDIITYKEGDKMNSKKIIDVKDIEKMQVLKEGESLITKYYIITCKKFQDTYILEWRKDDKKWYLYL